MRRSPEKRRGAASLQRRVVLRVRREGSVAQEDIGVAEQRCRRIVRRFGSPSPFRPWTSHTRRSGRSRSGRRAPLGVHLVEEHPVDHGPTDIELVDLAEHVRDVRQGSREAHDVGRVRRQWSVVLRCRWSRSLSRWRTCPSWPAADPVVVGPDGERDRKGGSSVRSDLDRSEAGRPSRLGHDSALQRGGRVARDGDSEVELVLDRQPVAVVGGHVADDIGTRLVHRVDAFLELLVCAPVDVRRRVGRAATRVDDSESEEVDACRRRVGVARITGRDTSGWRSAAAPGASTAPACAVVAARPASRAPARLAVCAIQHAHAPRRNC